VLIVAVLFSSLLSGGDALPATVVSAGFTRSMPINVAPGQIITFFLHGVGATLTKPVRASTLPLPNSLAGISAIFVEANPSVPIPILAVEPIAPCADTTQPGCASSYIAVTVQIPFNIAAADPEARSLGDDAVGQVRFSENGSIAASVDVLPFVDQVHVVRTCDEMLETRTFSCVPIVTHSDGSLVSDSNPAKAGEVLVMYAVGLGYTSSIVPNGEAPGSPVSTSVTFGVSYDARPNAGASRPPSKGEGNVMRPRFVGLIPGFVGIYQINVKVPALPSDAQACDPSPLSRYILSNLTINIFGPASVDGVGICVQPGS
jgi:uncharacterized protein (TIGR03437 family)